MNILDSHHHIWIPEQTNPDIGYVWLRDIGSIKPFGDPTPIQRDYTWDEFSNESRQHQLTGSVFLQVDAALVDPVAETAWAQSAINLPENTFGTVGMVNLSSDKAYDVIQRHSQLSSFRGVRQIISFLDDNPSLCFAPEHWLRNPLWCDQFQLLKEFGLSFDLQLYPEQMLEAAEFLSQHPSVPVVIDHAGSPYDQSESGFALWREGLASLSQLDNVCIKLSGFGMFQSDWSAGSIQPMVYAIMELFGPKRTMFGSNFPVDKLMASYDDTVERVLTCIATADDSAVNDVFEQTARRFYRLQLADS